MLDLELMWIKLNKAPEVLYVQQAVNNAALGLEVIVNSGIKLYDEEALDRLVTLRPEFSIVKDNICNMRQEHRYFITNEYCHRLRHQRSGAFCDPFLSMGSMELQVRKCIQDCDHQGTVDSIIADTQSLNVQDAALMRHLYAYLTKDTAGGN